MYILFVVLMFSVCSGEIQTCYQGWFYFQALCYGFGASAATWADAQVICELYHARLAEIHTMEENNFLKNISNMQRAEQVWIGGADIFQEGYWEWVGSKTAFSSTLTDWAPGDPNNANGGGGEDCLSLSQSQKYQWIDVNCDNKAFFICEMHPIETAVG